MNQPRVRCHLGGEAGSIPPRSVLIVEMLLFSAGVRLMRKGSKSLFFSSNISVT
jgi:hypothetical protein